jgi:hypothetical protein
MTNLLLGTVVRQLGFHSSSTSSLFLNSEQALLSAGFYEDSNYRQLVNIIPKVFFYFHYPAYKGDLLFKSRVLPFYGRFNNNGFTHVMSYRIDLLSLSQNVLAYPFNTIKGNYYMRPSMTRRNHYQVENTSTNVTTNVLATNITYIGGITTIGIVEGSPENNPMDSITFKLRDVDLVFTTLFKL